MKSLAFATLFAFALAPSYGFAQVSKMSDEDLIKLSLSAAPEAVAKDATVVAMGMTARCGHAARNRAVDVHARSRRSGQSGPDVRRSERDGMGHGLDAPQGASGQ